MKYKLTDVSISFEKKHIIKVQKVKFLGLTIYNYLSWNFHIEETIPKLNEACFAITSVRPYLSHEVVTKIYFSYFHSIMSYGNLFFLFSFYYVLWQFIFLIFILLCLMALYFGVVHLKTILYSRLKQAQLELL